MRRLKHRTGRTFAAKPRSAIQISPRLALGTVCSSSASYIPNSVSEAPIAAAYLQSNLPMRQSSDGSLSIAASISVTVLTSTIYPASQTSASFEPHSYRTFAPLLEAVSSRREELAKRVGGRTGERWTGFRGRCYFRLEQRLADVIKLESDVTPLSFLVLTL